MGHCSINLFGWYFYESDVPMVANSKFSKPKRMYRRLGTLNGFKR